MASGLLLALTFPIAPLDPWLPLGLREPLAFVAFIPWLLGLRGTSLKGAAALGFVGGLAFYLSRLLCMFQVVYVFGGKPFGVALLTYALMALYESLYWLMGGVFVAAWLRAGRRLLWAFPALWVALELLRGSLFTGMPACHIGHSVLSDLALVQWAAWFGESGLVFFVTFMNAWGADLVSTPRRTTGDWAKGPLVLALAHALGLGWLVYTDDLEASAPALKVALVQSNVDHRVEGFLDKTTQFMGQSQNPLTEAADENGADLIIWSEASLPMPLGPRVSDLHRAGLSKPSYRAHLLVGNDQAGFGFSRRIARNTMFLGSPSLEVLGAQSKQHLVPFGEYVPWGLERYGVGSVLGTQYEPGTSRVLETQSLASLSGGTAKLGVTICFDSAFPAITRTFVSQGANLLVVATNDSWLGATGGAEEFFRMARLRAVETGRSVVRSAKTGPSGFFTASGRIRSRTDVGVVRQSAPFGEAALKAPESLAQAVPLLSHTTPYALWGDGPAWVGLLAFAATVFRKNLFRSRVRA